jgi:hypothetical protein
MQRLLMLVTLMPFGGLGVALADDLGLSDGSQGLLGVAFGPGEDVSTVSADKAPQVFLGGSSSSHALTGQTGTTQYVHDGRPERWDLAFDKATVRYYYYHEEGWPNYKWAYSRHIGAGGYVTVWYQRPDAHDGQWFKFDRAFVTKLATTTAKPRR